MEEFSKVLQSHPWTFEKTQPRDVILKANNNTYHRPVLKDDIINDDREEH